nr:hypothetical protein [Tanacetum cinerariifolium]
MAILLRFNFLNSLFKISTGSSIKFNLASTRISSKGTCSVGSAKHFLRSATDSSILTKPIQKSQVVLVDIPKNLEENDSIVAEHGLSSKITQSPGESSNTSEGSKNSRSFEDSGRLNEEYSENRASSKEGCSETPQVRRSTRESKALVRTHAQGNNHTNLTRLKVLLKGYADTSDIILATLAILSILLEERTWLHNPRAQMDKIRNQGL